MDAAQVTIFDCLVSPYLAWEKNVALSHQLIMLKLGILALMYVTTCFSFFLFSPNGGQFSPSRASA